MADVSVRVAEPRDAAAVAAVQVAAWREAYAAALPAEVTPEAVAAAWADALAKPGDARNRVLVALAGSTVTGFAITSPCADPDADPIADGTVEEFTVAPGARRAGHGSRLLQACVDTLRADRFTRATWWVTSTDDALREFVTAGGWAADGATRELEGPDGVRIRQVRLHTAL